MSPTRLDSISERTPRLRFLAATLIGLAISGQSIAASGITQSQTGCSIRGVVSAATKPQGLAGATLRLTSPQFRFTVSQKTNRTGRFSFRNLPAGQYRVAASLAPYLDLEVGQTKPGGKGRIITLHAGHCTEELTVVLMKGGVIAGQVLDESGEPVPRVRVRGYRRRPQNGYLRASVAATGTTNDLGEYRLFGLPSDVYFVSATPLDSWMPRDELESDTESTSGPTYYQTTTDVSDAQLVTVEAGRVTSGIDISLVPSSSVRLRGHLLGPTGTPIAGARVSLSHAAFLEDVASVQSGTDGMFEFRGIAPGTYLLRGIVRAASADPLVASQSIQLTRDVTDFRLRGLSGRLTGVVRMERNNDSQLARFQLRAVPTDSGLFPPPFPSPTASLTSPSWAFDIEAGVGRVWLVPFNLSPEWAVKAILLNGVDVSDAGIDVRPGVATTGIEVVLSDRMGRIKGTVTDENEKTYTGETTVIVIPDEATRLQIQGMYVRVSHTDPTGQFSAVNLPDGAYHVLALQEFDISDVTYDLLERLRSRGTAVTIGGGDATISVKVLAARN
jgi:hypothetical protein